MFENDYIMRMIRQLFQMIVHIFQKIESEKIDEALKRDTVSAINRILLKTGEQSLSDNLYKLLIPYHEEKGEFGKAEDCLFELADPGCEDALQIGESFYSSLLHRPDTELEQGNLSRIGAEEGLKELRARFNI